MINSRNEWGRLRKCVVGSASHANWPVNDPVFKLESTRTSWTQTPVPSGPVPQWIIDQANQDLDVLAHTLQDLGVEVVRPTPLDFQALDGFYNYCPRDRFLVYGSTIVNPAMMYPCRDMEIQSYHHIVDQAQHYKFMPRHEGMILDAANVLRLNDRMLMLESASGNRQAYDWLCAEFPDVEIELCNFYAGVHIDSTVMPLREGLVMFNASRVRVTQTPRVFDGWHKIWVQDVVAQDFYQYPYASKWIGMNLLVVDHDTVIVDAAQTELIRILESYRFTVIPLQLRQSRTLGGGFHCVTLDLVRD